MSRTVRRKNTIWYRGWWVRIEYNLEHEGWWEKRQREKYPGLTGKQIAKRIANEFHSDAGIGSISNPPKWFRQESNRQFRTRNKRILRKAVKEDIDFVGIPFRKTINYDWW